MGAVAGRLEFRHSMQRAISTYLFVNQKLTAALLADIERAGFSQVELFCSRAHFDYRSAGVIRELEEWLKEHTLAVHALHAPTGSDFAPVREGGVPISISDPERVRRLDAVDEIKHALDIVEKIPFQFLIQHIGGGREGMDPRRFDAAFNSLEHLAMFAKQRGITVALENTPGELASPLNLRHFIEDTRLRDLRLCFDIGHAHMEEGIERSYETMRDFVVTAHVHDNRGEKDEHLFPYEGTIDWAATLQMLRTAPAAPGGLPLVLELKEPAPAGVHARPLEQAAAVFDKFEQELAACEERGRSARP